MTSLVPHEWLPEILVVPWEKTPSGAALGREHALEKGMAAHSSILAWRIPWMEEPDGLHPVGLQRVGHD